LESWQHFGLSKFERRLAEVTAENAGEIELVFEAAGMGNLRDGISVFGFTGLSNGASIPHTPSGHETNVFIDVEMVFSAPADCRVAL
jgi:hypothetical protein